jgi:adenylate cyclase
MPRRVFYKRLDPQQVQSHVSPDDYGTGIDLGQYSRHECAVVFFDLVNFTNISWSLTTDELMSILQPLFATAAHRINHYNGIVDKFPGDGVVGFFPRHYNEDTNQIADRALDCAASVMKWFYETLRVKVECPKPSHTLELCAGVDAGTIAIAHVGSNVHSELILLGDQVNCASKCQAVADKREVVVGQDAVDLVHYRGLVEPHLSTGPATHVVYTKDNRQYLSYRFDWESYAKSSWIV